MIGETFKPALASGAMDDDKIGEGFEFDPIIVAQTLFASFGLADEAKVRLVDLGLASDRAKLKNKISHVASGLKYIDVAMRNPFTKLPLVLPGSDSFVESRNLCFSLRIVIAKDNKKTLAGFSVLYDAFSTGSVSRGMQCKQFIISVAGDMKLR